MKTHFFSIIFLFTCLTAFTQNFNPIIPDNIADPSISKFGDTYYLYGTSDIDRGLEEMGPPVVWKSKDFVNWSFEGTILNEIDWNKPLAFTNNEGKKHYGYFRYWAPGRAIKIDNLYYLFPTIVAPDGSCPVYTVVSESPDGPFRFQNGDGLFWGEVPEGKKCSQPLTPDIDVEPFIDDDGNNYVFWRNRQAAQINHNFSSIVGDIITMPTKRTAYSEGPTMFKRDGVYYYVYTQGGGQNYRNAYMMSNSGPLNGFVAPEGNDVFISSSLKNGIWGPGHGNVFYDEASDTYMFAYLEYGEGRTTRQVFVNEMEFNPDGTIKTIIPDFEGVGYLNNPPDTRTNLALLAKATASSHKRERVSTERIETDQNNPKPNEGSVVTISRTFTYKPEHAIDGSNGTRWVASGDDIRPNFRLEFEEVTKIDRCDMYFTLPSLGHAWILEKSINGHHWEVCYIQDELVARSPHTATEIGDAKYLRIKIIKGDPGLWEFKVY